MYTWKYTRIFCGPKNTPKASMHARNLSDRSVTITMIAMFEKYPWNCGAGQLYLGFKVHVKAVEVQNSSKGGCPLMCCNGGCHGRLPTFMNWPYSVDELHCHAARMVEARYLGSFRLPNKPASSSDIAESCCLILDEEGQDRPDGRVDEKEEEKGKHIYIYTKENGH